MKTSSKTTSLELKLEVAQTSAELAHGLMFRRSLANDSGMLFRFSTPVHTGFWGKDTYIPLDIAFLDEDSTIVDIKSIAPLSTRIVNSSQPYVTAIETNAGFFKDNGIHIGDRVEIAGTEQSSMVVGRFKKYA